MLATDTWTVASHNYTCAEQISIAAVSCVSIGVPMQWHLARRRPGQICGSGQRRAQSWQQPLRLPRLRCPIVRWVSSCSLSRKRLLQPSLPPLHEGVAAWGAMRQPQKNGGNQISPPAWQQSPMESPPTVQRRSHRHPALQAAVLDMVSAAGAPAAEATGQGCGREMGTRRPAIPGPPLQPMHSPQVHCHCCSKVVPHLQVA